MQSLSKTESAYSGPPSFAFCVRVYSVPLRQGRCREERKERILKQKELQQQPPIHGCTPMHHREASVHVSTQKRWAINSKARSAEPA